LEKPLSMNAVFIQMAPAELARIEANPGLAEPLFTPNFASPWPNSASLANRSSQTNRPPQTRRAPPYSGGALSVALQLF
jgi:hypothetical protein